MMSRAKHFFWKQKSIKLAENLDQIHYGEYDKTQLLALRELANIVYPVTGVDREFRKQGFSLGTETFDAFERLEDAFFEGRVAEELNKLLHDYERYELLSFLVEM